MLSSIFIEGGIFVSHGIWLFRTRKVREKARLAGLSFDDLPESSKYHVDVPRRGSIAVTRDYIKDEIQRKGSAILEKDVELGEEVPVDAVISAHTHAVPMGVLPKGSVAAKSGPQVTGEEVEAAGVEAKDYGTIPRDSPAPKVSRPKARPGFVRQDSNFSTAAQFREPKW